MKLSKEIFDKLSNYTDYLYTATYASFVRLTDSKHKAELDALYKEVYGTDGRILTGCNRCVYTALKRLGTDYYADKKEYDAQEVDKESEPKTETIDKEVVTKPKTKKAANKE